MRSLRWRALAAVVIAGLAAVAAGTSSSAPLAKASSPKPATKAQWAKIVAAAKREGSVTIYSSQTPTSLADFAKAFQAKYGITVTVNRQIDIVETQQLTAEHGVGSVKADMFVVATKSIALGAQKPQNRWATDAVGPALFAKGYDRSIFAKPAKAVVVGININCLGWNTTQVPGGLHDHMDLLNPSLKGRIGVIVPSVGVLVDLYHWLEETYGKNFLPRLAAQDPKLYTSASPMTQAVASGELAAAMVTALPTTLDLKDQGAPIGCTIVKGAKTWNTAWYGMVLRKAPHPNAAQLLMNYMLTPEGQALVQRRQGTPLHGVPNSTYVVPRKQDLKALAPDKVAEFQRYWDSLFRK